MFGLSVDALRKIREAFAGFPQIEKVVIYGSRAKGNHRKGSDIDITLIGKNLNLENTIYPLTSALDDLYLPYTFDISIFNQLDEPEFIDHILRVGKTFYERENGEIDGWPIYKLEKLATISAGNSAPQNKEFFQDGLYPFIRTADVGKIKFGKINSTADYLNDTGIKKLRLYPKDTILLPKSGASTFLNHRVIMGMDGYVASHLATIEAKTEKILPWFLLYFLNTVKAQDLVQDHSYPSLNLNLIQSIPVLTPPLSEQKRVVATLDKAFTAIETAITIYEAKTSALAELEQSILHRAFSGELTDYVGVTDHSQ